MRVRALNNDGIEEFRSFIHATRMGDVQPVPYGILETTPLTYATDGFAEVEEVKFATRLEAARYLSGALQNLSESEFYNSGLWSWLSLFYFEQLCPQKKSGQRIIGKDYRLIPTEDWRNYYRHLLAGPVGLFRAHDIYSRIFLTNPLHRVGDINESFASRQEIIGSEGIVKAIDTIYYSEKNETFKKGCTSQDRPGTLRRFVTIIKQFALTFDLNGMDGDEIVALLPAEFDRFRNRE